jgi:hypothetical protein
MPTTGMIQSATAISDYTAITAAYRRLYASVQPTHLHASVVEHTRMDAHLLTETTGISRQILATALAEALLLAGRIEFFDLRRAEDADRTFVQALQAAGEADDPLLGSAILAHAAFIPGWNKQKERTADDKQRTVILGDLAAVEAAQESPESACQYAEEALDQLTRTWYATGMDRVLKVRKALQPWAGHECVQRLDDRLYGWQTTLSTLQH